MAAIRIRPTRSDIAIANAIADNTGPGTERTAEFLTWGADEHILCALAAGWWLYCRNRGLPCRRASNRVLLTTLVASALPHLLNTLFDQDRRVRMSSRGHLH